jgi:ATP-dependent helicase HrpB
VTHNWDRQELLGLLIEFICDSSSTYEEVLRHSLDEWIRLCVGEDEFTQLQKLAPSQITVGRGHKVQVNYTADSKPWVAARLQNFFGQSQTPRILNGSLPLTVHLLAPNMRALQVTTDLASFWKNTYPSLRNEYQRKYPRHSWPDNPMEAEPPEAPSRRPKR